MKVTLDTQTREISLLENTEIAELLHLLEDLDIDIYEWKIVSPPAKIEVHKEWYPYYSDPNHNYNDKWPYKTYEVWSNGTGGVPTVNATINQETPPLRTTTNEYKVSSIPDGSSISFCSTVGNSTVTQNKNVPFTFTDNPAMTSVESLFGGLPQADIDAFNKMLSDLVHG